MRGTPSSMIMASFALHTLPSGVFYSHITNIIGNGVALDIRKLTDELTSLLDAGVPAPNLIISERAQLLMPYHVLQDAYEEERLGGHAFGSTKSGIAPFYSDKYAKIGIQVCDLFDEDRLKEHLDHAVDIKNVLFEQPVSQAPHRRRRAVPGPADGLREMHRALCGRRRDLPAPGREGRKIHPAGGPAGRHEGPGPGHLSHDHLLPHPGRLRLRGRCRAPHSHGGRDLRVQGLLLLRGLQTEPFVSELFGDEAGDELRRRGGDAGEFGATTGRPRRVGWFDAVATKYGCMVQGATQVALTCLDVLGYLDEIQVCTGYEIDGKVTTDFPVPALLERGQARLHHPARLEERHPRHHGLRRPARQRQGLCRLHRKSRSKHPSASSPPAPSATRSLCEADVSPSVSCPGILRFPDSFFCLHLAVASAKIEAAEILAGYSPISLS